MMIGDLPTMLGSLIKLKDLDLSKFSNWTVKFVLIDCTSQNHVIISTLQIVQDQLLVALCPNKLAI